MNEFYAICNWATMVPDFIEGGGGAERETWNFRTLSPNFQISRYNTSEK